ncbi:uncharacterized protein ATNIH1004_011140 [Aspergillus tanneri]|uniref:Uncharacterized protein n=1 Tax=Aspergillus tanneri TaxID=1220188 RepID=A0A5M9MCD3_9EURO|nr:uncharacterized protein ATNIH1004_011140 [Aspergillus tanneri]KAA8642199.1 hypothetical protein ATNIH1004_011140 [Aspergillus tanneri]
MSALLLGVCKADGNADDKILLLWKVAYNDGEYWARAYYPISSLGKYYKEDNDGEDYDSPETRFAARQPSPNPHAGE